MPTTRNKVIYREGEVADRVFLVIKGEYELSRKLHSGVSEGTAGVIERFGGRKVPPPGYRQQKDHKNILTSKFSEVTDVSLPECLPLTVFGPGTLVGEEDVVFRDYYSCTLRCLSQKGMIY